MDDKRVINKAVKKWENICFDEVSYIQCYFCIDGRKKMPINSLKPPCSYCMFNKFMDTGCGLLWAGTSDDSPDSKPGCDEDIIMLLTLYMLYIHVGG